MISIAVCDDEKEIADKIRDIIYELEDRFEEDFDVICYNDSTLMCEKLSEGLRHDIIFLDISMPGMDGVAVGQHIRNKLGDNQTQIVYVSSDSRYAMELFKVQPMEFLIKPVNIQKMERIMQLAYKILCDGRQIFRYELNGDNYREPVNNIIYFESKGRKLYMHTEKCSVEFYGKLDDVYKQLERYNFKYIHKSYLVNVYKIKAFRKDCVLMENDVRLPISRSRRDEVRHICSTI